MQALQRTIFISDLHLQESEPKITAEFLQLLQSCDESVDAIYILGDFFEVWIGDDDESPFHQKIMRALKSVTARGLPIYFMHGNRDFLIGKRFAKNTGVQILSDEEKILLYGTPVLLLHGDTLCTRDIEYLKMRKYGKNKFVQRLFTLLPLTIRKKIAANMRQKSMQHTQSTPLEIMDVTQEEVERMMQKYNVNYLIHGHTHRPAIHHFMNNDIEKTRIVLDAWHDHGSALVWDEAGTKQIVLSQEINIEK